MSIASSLFTFFILKLSLFFPDSTAEKIVCIERADCHVKSQRVHVSFVCAISIVPNVVFMLTSPVFSFVFLYYLFRLITILIVSFRTELDDAWDFLVVFSVRIHTVNSVLT